MKKNNNKQLPSLCNEACHTILSAIENCEHNFRQMGDEKNNEILINNEMKDQV